MSDEREIDTDALRRSRNAFAAQAQDWRRIAEEMHRKVDLAHQLCANPTVPRQSVGEVLASALALMPKTATGPADAPALKPSAHHSELEPDE